eukprot:TRINITY_DN15268_c0_g1_i1.p1 TRINITY_DN15268_c0_g1~~TRINITY_DN15268_c0_g1_i1.p1  ORF type:complete len:257 (-),score=44.41 TRINITY_DN15268_c0_g1_i1:172-942(-)
MIPSTPSSDAAARPLRFGAPGADDMGRSPDEIRIIGEMAREDVEAFLAANPTVEGGAADQLRKEPPFIQLAVLDYGPLRHAREPSGVVISRIRMAKTGAQNQKQSLPSPPVVDSSANVVDQFIASNRIDHSAGVALKAEPPHIQQAVMARGSLLNSTNPSASLMSRIRQAKDGGGLANGLTAGSAMQPPPPAVSGLTADLSVEAARAAAALVGQNCFQPRHGDGPYKHTVAGMGQSQQIKSVGAQALHGNVELVVL